MDDDDADGKTGKVPLPGNEVDSPAKDIPAAGEVSAPAEALITQEYLQKAVFFLLIMAVVLFVVKRRRSANQKVDEKSMA